MLLDADLRSKFQIEIIASSKEVGGTIKTFLALAGYKVDWHKDEPNILSDKDFPHVSIVDIGTIKNLSIFIENRIKVNSESLFILVGPYSLATKIEQYRSYGVYSVINIGEGIESHALMQVDLVCSELFLRYQNEQLHDKISEVKQSYEDNVNNLQKALTELQLEAKTLTKQWETEKYQLNQIISNLEFETQNQKKQIEDLVWLSRSLNAEFASRIMKEKLDPISQLFCELESDLGNHKWIAWYFKFMPEVQAFVVTQYRRFNDKQTFPFSSFKPQTVSVTDLFALLHAGDRNVELFSFVAKHFDITNLQVFPISYSNLVDGIFCFIGQSEEKANLISRRVNFIMQIFHPLLAFSRLESSLGSDLSKRDTVTQLELRDAYYDRLTSEFLRAKRLHHGLSVIKVGIDNLNEIAAIHGLEVINILLSQTAMIIKSSSRVNDFTFRTGENEFSLILPHTPIKGAAIRAERLRRIVEMHEFVGYSAGHATISMGISEFPSLVDTVERLDQSATEALVYIQKRSVNKVCLYSPGVNG